MNGIVIYYCFPECFLICYIFEGLVICIYTILSSGVVLVISSFVSRPISFLASNSFYTFLLRNLFSRATSVIQNLMSQFYSLPFFLFLLNGMF
jgi:hypothetical protein